MEIPSRYFGLIFERILSSEKFATKSSAKKYLLPPTIQQSKVSRIASPLQLCALIIHDDCVRVEQLAARLAQSYDSGVLAAHAVLVFLAQRHLCNNFIT